MKTPTTSTKIQLAAENMRATAGNAAYNDLPQFGTAMHAAEALDAAARSLRIREQQVATLRAALDDLADTINCERSIMCGAACPEAAAKARALLAALDEGARGPAT